MHQEHQLRATLWWASLAHFLNDGLEAAITPLLPFIAADLALTYGQAGAVKSALNALISLSQLPAGFLANYLGEAGSLGLGLGWLSGSFLAMGLAGSYPVLLLLMASAGIGGGVYHPVGTAWVSRVFWGGQRGTAVGTLNFSGDVGKVVLPAIAGTLAVWMGWRHGLVFLGGIGVLAALSFLFWAGAIGRARQPTNRLDPASGNGVAASAMRLQATGESAKLGVARPKQFALICTIGLMDQAQRAAVLAFLGFLLLGKGQPEAALGWLVAVTLAGGALGKFGCGWLTDRLEDRRVMAMTEIGVTVGAMLLAFLDLGPLLVPLLLAFGFALNGTSSVIYTRLADTLQPEYFSRGYGLYYTLSFGSSALAPVLYGLLADRQGLNWVYPTIAIVTLGILPLIALLQGTKGTMTND